MAQTVPAAFVKAHANKFQRTVGLGYEGGRPRWQVTVTMKFHKGIARVSFGAGLKNFAIANGIEEGDRVRFSLVSMSIFNVSKLG